jgi:hypothetical protein
MKRKNYITYLRERNSYEGLIISKDLTIKRKDRLISLLKNKISILNSAYITLATHLIYVERKLEKISGPPRVPLFRVKKHKAKLVLDKITVSKPIDPLANYRIPKIRISKALLNPTPKPAPAI